MNTKQKKLLKMQKLEVILLQTKKINEGVKIVLNGEKGT
jgi:flagellar motor switch/type III secretory pathway protein FliN